MKKLGKKYLIYLVIVSAIIIILAILYAFNMQNGINQVLGQ